jgi:DNA invertase Pin-like site-specific DNA recombinase
MPARSPPRTRGPKLTCEDVREIRRVATTGTRSAQETADKYGLWRAYVYKIINWERWEDCY